MKCLRLDLQRKYLRYIHGELSESSIVQIEKHMACCKTCLRRIEGLRANESLLTDLPLLTPTKDPWLQIEAKFQESGPAQQSRSFARWQSVAILIAFGLISAALGAAAYGKLIQRNAFRHPPIIRDKFVPVSITGIASSKEPHVVTEGYVTEVKIQKDGDRVFRIVNDPKQTEPFVICEMIPPIHLSLPVVGSRVRVFGVSRYDGKENHQWHELHPVLNVEVIHD